MSDKMRSEFEKWYMTNTFAHVDHLSVFYNDLNCYSTPIANQCWKAWQAARTAPEGYVMVPKTIHPFDRPDCDAVVQLLATPPDAGRIDNPQDYYQYWWELLLSAAPEGKK